MEGPFWSFALRMVNLVRVGAVKAKPSQRGGDPWRGESPRELRAYAGLTHRHKVADSHVEQSLEGGGVSQGLASLSVFSGLFLEPGIRFSPLVGSKAFCVAIPNVKRVMALETTHGCVRGAML